MSVAQTVRRNASFGGRVPPVIGGLIAVTVLLSILSTATVVRLGVPWVAQYATLQPGEVVHGQLWRLFTWIFVAQSPLGLLFGCLSLFWFGRELHEVFGPQGFLARYLAGGAIAGTIATLVAWPFGLGSLPFAGAEAMTFGALIVVWALYWPDRIIRFYFVVPLQGWTLVGVTIALTTLYGLYASPWLVLPEYAAEAVAILFVYRRRLFSWIRLPRRRKKPPATNFQVWDEDKQRFRPPKWMN